MARPRIIVIRHGDDPPDDRAHTELLALGYAVETVRPCWGEPLPALDGSIAGSVVHGGPFAVYAQDAFPFLRDEHRWMNACLEAELPLLGICQGAQSLAYILGADVGPPDHGRHEFGYYPIRPTADGVACGFLEEPLVVCQAHYHGFELPRDAQRLAESDDYPNQAFRWGSSAWGVQFHAEVTIDGFRRWQRAPGSAYGAPGAQTRDEQTRLMHAHDEAMADWFRGFMRQVFPAADPRP